MSVVSTEAVRSLQERVRSAASSGTPIIIRAGGTKDFYGNAANGGDVLDPREYCGITEYEPTELVITACSGTPLGTIEATLAEHNQMLAFEPPHFGPTATIGGMVASGLAGPRRMAAGSIRDSLLGATLMDGRGNVLRFGGKVMKNVAGYDVGRALAGSLGTLGLIMDVSLKVMPRPAIDQTLRFDSNEADAITLVNQWAGKPLPISATAWIDGALFVRLSGSAAGVQAASAALPGEPADNSLWSELREQTHIFFNERRGHTLWRLSVPPTTPSLNLGDRLIEWRGALRWVWSRAAAAEIRSIASTAGGHATAFRGVRDDAFTPLPPAVMQIHRRLKDEFDPRGIFNHGRMYPDL